MDHPNRPQPKSKTGKRRTRVKPLSWEVIHRGNESRGWGKRKKRKINPEEAFMNQ